MAKDLKDGEKNLTKQEKERLKKALQKQKKKANNKKNKQQAKQEESNSKQNSTILEQLTQLEKEQPKNTVIEEEPQIQEQIEQEIVENKENNNNGEQEDQEQQNGDQQEQNGEIQEAKEYQILTGKYYEEFKDVFENFDNLANRMLSKTIEIDEPFQNKEKEENEQEKLSFAEQRKKKKEQERQEKAEKESRKQKKQNRSIKVAELKSLVKRPDLVEAWDVTAPDPLLLVQLKSTRNTVEVPDHWCQKRKYLQNKRGILKTPFQLPENIENTGIAKLRDPFSERDGIAMVKQKLRDRMNPKMGKIDIDYEVLHDAFFKEQKKPKLTIFGDMYFEGKEDEIQTNKYKPGRLSEEMRNCLGISEYQPPPWLINMQRYGPPPTFPHLKIMGLHAETSGFISKQQNEEQASKAINQPGVYAYFRADIFEEDYEPVDKGYWGQVIEDDDDDEEEEEQGEEMEGGSDDDDSGDLQPDFGEQIDRHQEQMNARNAQSGTSSVLDGLETPEVDLRRGQIEDQFQYSSGGTSSGPQPPQQASELPLFQVLQPTQAGGSNQGQIFGSQQTYILPPNPNQQQ